MPTKVDKSKLTPDQKKNLLDKDWRVNHLYKIKDKHSNLLTFKRNRAQEHFNLHKHTRNIILKARRLGFTTFECIDSLDDVLWTPNFNMLFLSYDADSAIEIFDDKVKYAWDNYYPELKMYKLDADRANKLKFEFGDGTSSSILVRTKGRSGSYNRLHISEFGKICKESPAKAKEIISGTIQAVPTGCRVDVESTAEGDFGAFNDMFWNAWNRGAPTNTSEYKAHFYNWTWDDEEIAKVEATIPFDQMKEGEKFQKYKAIHKLTDIQITFYYLKWIELERDWKLLQQEYPTTPEEAFISSGNKLFDTDKLKIQQERYVREPEKEGNWKIFEPYMVGHNYAMGVDPAEGTGGDNSACVIWDFTLKPRIVATFKSDSCPPDQLAYECREYGMRYRNCLIGVERNNHGHAVIQKLREIYDEDRIYKEIRYDKEEDQETEKFGWLTHKANKPKMLYDLASVINDEFVEIPDQELLFELRTYEREDLSDIRYDPEAIKHWDSVIASAIGFQMRGYIEDYEGEIKTVSKPTYVDIHSEI